MYEKQLMEEIYIRFYYFLTKDHLGTTIELKYRM